MKSQKLKQTNAMEKRFNLIFLLVCAAIGIFIFARVAYREYRIGTDYSVDLSAVGPELLIKSHSPSRGPEKAKVILVVFMDPQCHACRTVHYSLRQIEGEFGNDLRIITRYLPFTSESKFAIAVVEEARDLGKFDEALDILLEKQSEWGNHRSPNPGLIPTLLQKINLSAQQLDKEIVIARHKWKYELDEADAGRIGVARAPTIFINGRIQNGLTYEALHDAIERQVMVQ